MFEKIKACKYDFSAPSWESISTEAKDFISKLLVADPKKRLQGSAILEHPWIKGETTKKDADSGVLDKMREWNSKRKL